jgi:hypothetical protein
MIESTAQVISGNSGGALINDEGKLSALRSTAIPAANRLTKGRSAT